MEAGLAAFRGPPGAHVVLEARDDYLDWNNGVYDVSWDEAGAAQVKRTRREREVALDVRTLTQLLVGFLDGGEALDAGLLQTDLALRDLTRLFPHKPLYQNDHFYVGRPLGVLAAFPSGSPPTPRHKSMSLTVVFQLRMVRLW